jgi:hypothetical protein
VQADGGGPAIEWKGWKISSNEIWNLEGGVQPRFPLRFALANAFDGDPNTTWAYTDSGKTYLSRMKHNPNHVPLVHRPYSSENARSVTLEPASPVSVDEIWILNGHVKRPDLFKRNDRVVRLRIDINGKTVKEVALSDTMGWHKVSIPRAKAGSITLGFTGIRKGSGPDNDVCISEIALRNNGRNIAMHMPQSVLYRLRACCGGEGYLLKRGAVVAQGMFGEGTDLMWSPNGSRLAGVENSGRLWVADVNRSRVVYRARLKSGQIAGIKWLGKRTIRATFYSQDDAKPAPRPQTFRVPSA